MRPFKKLALMILMATTCLASSVQAKAASCRLTESKPATPAATFKSFDLNGNKKKDTLQIRLKGGTSGNYSSCQITLNGKTLKTFSKSGRESICTANAQIFTLQNKKAYIAINVESSDNETLHSGIYRFSGSKLIKVFDFNNAFKNKLQATRRFNQVRINKVTGNRISFTGWQLYPACGHIKVTYTLTPGKNGYFVRTSCIGRAAAVNNRSLRINKAVNLYKSHSGKAAVSKTRVGTYAAVSNISITGHKVRLKIKTTDGKTGWINLNQTAGKDQSQILASSAAA